jgi:thiosulfate dehydrogenase [quinone] large subunit
MTTLTDQPSTALAAAPLNAESSRSQTAARYVFAAIRIGLGWLFLWAFLDKVFGLGVSTPAKSAWLDGGHPTAGFLGKSAAGPFAGIWNNAAGTDWADWLFMAGLAGIGIALIAGIGMRVAAVTGALLYVLMWSVVLPPTANPFLDDHLISAAVLIGLALINAGDTFGLGRRWSQTDLVRRMPWLK